jgi:hypothetical protein
MQFPQPAQSPPPAAKRPNCGTAVAAGVLAVLIGLLHLFGFVAQIVRTVQDGSFLSTVIGLGFNGAACTCLLTGGVLLFVRRRAGRTLVVIGAGAALLTYALVLTGMATAVAGVGTGLRSGVAVATAAVVVVALPSVAIIVLALSRPTGRWLDAAVPSVPVPGRGRYPGQQW